MALNSTTTTINNNNGTTTMSILYMSADPRNHPTGHRNKIAMTCTVLSPDMAWPLPAPTLQQMCDENMRFLESGAALFGDNTVLQSLNTDDCPLTFIIVGQFTNTNNCVVIDCRHRILYLIHAATTFPTDSASSNQLASLHQRLCRITTPQAWTMNTRLLSMSTSIANYSLEQCSQATLVAGCLQVLGPNPAGLCDMSRATHHQPLTSEHVALLICIQKSFPLPGTNKLPAMVWTPANPADPLPIPVVRFGPPVQTAASSTLTICDTDGNQQFALLSNTPKPSGDFIWSTAPPAGEVYAQKSLEERLKQSLLDVSLEVGGGGAGNAVPPPKALLRMIHNRKCVWVGREARLLFVINCPTRTVTVVALVPIARTAKTFILEYVKTRASDTLNDILEGIDSDEKPKWTAHHFVLSVGEGPQMVQNERCFNYDSIVHYMCVHLIVADQTDYLNMLTHHTGAAIADAQYDVIYRMCDFFDKRPDRRTLIWYHSMVFCCVTEDQPLPCPVQPYPNMLEMHEIILAQQGLRFLGFLALPVDVYPLPSLPEREVRVFINLVRKHLRARGATARELDPRLSLPNSKPRAAHVQLYKLVMLAGLDRVALAMSILPFVKGTGALGELFTRMSDRRWGCIYATPRERDVYEAYANPDAYFAAQAAKRLAAEVAAERAPVAVAEGHDDDDDFATELVAERAPVAVAEGDDDDDFAAEGACVAATRAPVAVAEGDDDDDFAPKRAPIAAKRAPVVVAETDDDDDLDATVAAERAPVAESDDHGGVPTSRGGRVCDILHKVGNLPQKRVDAVMKGKPLTLKEFSVKLCQALFSFIRGVEIPKKKKSALLLADVNTLIKSFVEDENAFDPLQSNKDDNAAPTDSPSVKVVTPSVIPAHSRHQSAFRPLGDDDTGNCSLGGDATSRTKRPRDDCTGAEDDEDDEMPPQQCSGGVGMQPIGTPPPPATPGLFSAE